MKYLITSMMLTAFAVSIAASAPAAATDGKTHASGVCQGTFASDRADAEYLVTELRASGSEVQMNCALVRDSMGYKMEWVDARVDKASNDDVPIYARVYSCNTAYHECSWKSTTNGGIVNADPGQHSFFVDTKSLPYSDTNGRYFSVWMRLPDGDSLMSIETLEQTD